MEDDGCAVFRVRSQRSAIHPNSASKWVTGVLDPTLGKAREVVSEWKPHGGWTATPFPVSAGYFVDEKNGEYRVRAVDASTAELSQLWNLGRRVPDRFAANGEVLVAVTFPESQSEGLGLAPNIPSNLVCVESTGLKRSRWRGSAEVESKVVWEFDLSSEWAEEEEYTSYPHLKNFHITRQVIP